MRYDYVDIVAMHASARRERAEAVYQLFVAPLVKLFSHAARTHRAPARPHRPAAA